MYNRSLKKIINSIENHIYPMDSNDKNIGFRKHKYSYLKTAAWPIGVYKRIQLHPEISIYPKFNFVKWASWILKKVHLRDSQIQFTDLIGPLLGWFLLKKEISTIRADIIISKKNERILVLLYGKQKKVVKVRPYKHSTKKEADNTAKAREIANINNYIRIPEIYHQNHETASYFVQELVKGKSLQRFNEKIKLKSFIQIYDFLLDLYSVIGLELKIPPILSLDISKMVLPESPVSKDFLRLHNIYIKIVESQKRCFWGFVHSDIHEHNILIDEKKQVWLIDWQKSRDDFVVLDLLKLPSPEIVFSRIKNLFPERDDILPYKYQVFVLRFVEVFQLIRSNRSKLKMEKDIEELMILSKQLA